VTNTTLTMPESFVPLVPAVAAARESSFTSLASQGLSPMAHKPALDAVLGVPATSSPKLEVCAKPKISLQRNGDIVSSIRIQCGCGEVVELTCVY
jgi:hypothetical protein